MAAEASKEDTTGILSRTSGLAGWRKAIRRVASLEETALADIDETYDSLVSKAEQEEWITEKLRLLREEAAAIASSTHSVRGEGFSRPFARLPPKQHSSLVPFLAAGAQVAMGGARPIQDQEGGFGGAAEEPTNRECEKYV